MENKRMGRGKRIGSFVAAVMLLMSLASVVSFAAYEEKVSSIASYQSFWGSERDYLYRDVGYKYKDCTCAVPGAYLKIELKMNTGFLGAWQSKGKVTTIGVNGTPGSYYGWTYQNANTSGKTKKGQFYFEPCDNSWGGGPNTLETIRTNTFIMYSQQ